MTLVVARVVGERVAIASDTRITQSGLPLQNHNGIVKSCILPGKVCASFSNSPELAAQDFCEFARAFPNGAEHSETVAFFERSSKITGNDYLLAFAIGPKLVKIVNGEIIAGKARTQWIGDILAYERFREYEAKKRKNSEAGRAVNAVLFADELNNSPASDLYSVMRNIVGDRDVMSAGGFVCVISNRESGFRHSVYSDMLYNWPEDESEDFILRLKSPINLGSAGENVGYAVAQVSTGFLNTNLVAFYLLKGRKLFLFHGENNGLPDKCVVLRDVEPFKIADRLNESVGANLPWLLMVTSPVGERLQSTQRPMPNSHDSHGLGLSFYCHANTFPKTKSS